MFTKLFSRQAKFLTINGAQPIEMQTKETILQAALRESSYILTEEELSQGYILACQAVPKEDVSISVELDSHGESFEIMSLTGQVKKQWQLTQDITALEISLPKSMPYAAGQYANLKIPGLCDAVRSYSFATAFNAESHLVQLYIKHVSGGALSSVVHDQELVGKDIELLLERK